MVPGRCSDRRGKTISCPSFAPAGTSASSVVDASRQRSFDGTSASAAARRRGRTSAARARRLGRISGASRRTLLDDEAGRELDVDELDLGGARAAARAARRGRRERVRAPLAHDAPADGERLGGAGVELVERHLELDLRLGAALLAALPVGRLVPVHVVERARVGVGEQLVRRADLGEPSAERRVVGAAARLVGVVAQREAAEGLLHRRLARALRHAEHLVQALAALALGRARRRLARARAPIGQRHAPLVRALAVARAVVAHPRVAREVELRLALAARRAPRRLPPAGARLRHAARAWRGAARAKPSARLRARGAAAART